MGLISFSVDEAEEEKVEKEKEEEKKELTRGASIQFDEKPANVIVNSTDASESDGKDDDGEEEGEGGADATSEELNDIARLNLGEGVGSKLRRNSLDRVPMRRKSSLAGK